MIVKIYSIAANLHLIRYDIDNDFQTYAQCPFLYSLKDKWNLSMHSMKKMMLSD